MVSGTKNLSRRESISRAIRKSEKSNAITRERLETIWRKWEKEKNVQFTERVIEETLGFGKGLIEVAKQFEERRNIVMKKMAQGAAYDLDLNDVLPPMSNDILEELFRIARKNGLAGQQISETILAYLNDIDALLEIPKIRIGSAMYAGLAHKAKNGKICPPKSLNDVEFISSYLPYCDAIFVDKESELLLKEFPKNTPSYLKPKEFSTQIFSLRNKDAFLDYLDKIVSEIPKNQIEILKDIKGEDYTKPYWNIINHEKITEDSR